LRYDKSGEGWGHGDAVWACTSRNGNGTDFHSLFLGMKRASGFPARFEIGFPLPESKTEGNIPSYHCWAAFYLDVWVGFPLTPPKPGKILPNAITSSALMTSTAPCSLMVATSASLRTSTPIAPTISSILSLSSLASRSPPSGSTFPFATSPLPLPQPTANWRGAVACFAAFSSSRLSPALASRMLKSDSLQGPREVSMSPKILLRALALLLAAGSFSAVRLAAQDEPSVAEAARRARQQKQAAPKPARIIDNDSIPPSHNAPATPAADSAAAEANPSTPATSSDSNAPVKPEDTSAPPAEKGTSDADAAAAKKAKIEALKKQIADKKESVDLQQRAIALAQDTFYSNPDHVHDRDGKAKLDSMQSDLEQEKAELAELQAKLAELGDSADSNPAAAPPQP
jgi:hypothetical protein